MDRLDNPLYIEDLDTISKELDLSSLSGKTVMISGATGMIGTYIVDLLLHLDMEIKVVALGRSRAKAAERFPSHIDNQNFAFVECNVGTEMPSYDGNVDYIIHAASTTHPVAYASEPVGTILSNVFGLKNLLDYGIGHGLKRFVFLSSVEVYGENRGDVERFDENYCGYINPNTLRAGYPESKRLCESLCQAYRKEKAIEVVIPRLARTFGPTMLMSDTKAISQFIKKGLAKEDIVLKSEGTQLYTYTYAADAAAGVLVCMLNGTDGEAYNISSNENEITLKDLASTIAAFSDTKVVFEIPDNTERAGYSTATKALMDATKTTREMGWKARWDIKTGLGRTLEILKDICG